jgi:uncharacterized protein (DUF2062 family)
LRRFRPFLGHACLWHLNRYSVSGAFGVGLFWAFIPTPTQLLPAAACAIALRVNLPLSLALTWVANPFTMAPIFYFNYKVGVWLLQRPAQPLGFEWRWAWVADRLEMIWAPLLLGSLVVAVAAGLTGYGGMRAFWRRQAVRSWKHRQTTRARRG